MTLGIYPTISVAKALKKYEKASQLLKNGNDPALVEHTVIEEFQKVPTILSLVEEYLDKWAKARKKSWKEDQRILYKDVVPAWRRKKVWRRKKAQDVTRRDIVLLLDRIMERGAPIQANRTLSAVRKMFNFARSRGILDTSPCWAIAAPAKENRKDRVLIFWEGLKSARMERGTALVLTFQLISGQRKGEIATAEWKDLDLNQGWWTIPSEKSKNTYSHRIPLTRLALSILSEIKNIAGDSRWLFPSRRDDRHITQSSIDHAVRNNLDHFGIAPFTPHDLRRTAATHMASAGVSRLVIKKILNHTESDVTSIYDRHSYDKEKLQAMKVWEMKLQSILIDEKRELIADSTIYHR